VREATEQCERLWHPQLESPCEAGAWLARPAPGIALLATARRDALPLCSQRLRQLADGASEVDLAAGIRLAVGPEGGWSPEEEERAEAAGWHAVSLGGSILRTATAAVSGVALLADWRALRSASCRPPSP
jgi:16S rRNA (uracil1498-N3)-methyltransferase